MQQPTSRLWETLWNKWSGVFDKYIPRAYVHIVYLLSIISFLSLLASMGYFLSIRSLPSTYRHVTIFPILKNIFPDLTVATNGLPSLQPKYGLESMSIIASNLSPLILSRKQSKQVFVSTETDLLNVSTDLGDIPKSNGPSLVSSYFTFS